VLNYNSSLRVILNPYIYSIKFNMDMHIRKRHIVLALLILIPSFVNLGVPIYNWDSPELFGIPFFYWFQTVWLFASAGFYIAFAYLKGKNG